MRLTFGLLRFHCNDLLSYFLSCVLLVPDWCVSYMMAASMVGFYSSPLLRRLAPVPHNTSMIKVNKWTSYQRDVKMSWFANCAV